MVQSTTSKFNLNCMNKLKIIATYHILTTSIFIAYFFLGFTSSKPLISYVLYPMTFMLIGFNGYCGYALIKTPLLGVKLSSICQLMQAVSFSIPGFNYLFTTSRYFSFILSESFNGINFFGEIVAINISFDPKIESFGLQLFVVPIIIMFILIKEGFRIERSIES